MAPYSSLTLTAWQEDCCTEGFPGRLAGRSRLPGTAYPIRCETELSSTTSRRSLVAQNGMDPSVVGRMSSSSAVPSLSSGLTSTTSCQSLGTGMAAGIEGKYFLQDDGNGNLVIPSTVTPSSSQPRLIYQCLFHTLKCEERFDAFGLWRTHVLSHFRANPSPSVARCPFCTLEFSDTRRGKAWNDLLNHAAAIHFERGETISNSRPDFELMKHLYNLKIITADQFKNVQLLPPRSNLTYVQSHDSGIGTRDEPCFASHNPNRERRERERRWGVFV